MLSRNFDDYQGSNNNFPSSKHSPSNQWHSKSRSLYESTEILVRDQPVKTSLSERLAIWQGKSIESVHYENERIVPKRTSLSPTERARRSTEILVKEQPIKRSISERLNICQGRSIESVHYDSEFPKRLP